MKISKLKISSNFFLAPMSGISDYPYREVVKEFKPGLVFSEMIASRALIEKNKKTLKMIKKDSNEIIEENKSIISHGKLKLDPSQLECEWGGKQLPDKLTTTEFLLVKELAKRPGIIKERAQLMDIAYREDTDIEDRTIDSHVKRIRKKFKKVDPEFSAIETRYGSGYRWNVS